MSLREPCNTKAMCPNIYVVGAQSTGKTTLVSALEAHYSSRAHCGRDAEEKEGERRKEDKARTTASHSYHYPLIIREVARKLLDERRWKGDTITTSAGQALALQKLIVHAQSLAEQEAMDAMLRLTPPPGPPSTSCQCGPSQDSAAPSFFISDRSAVDSIVYARQYAGLLGSLALTLLPEWQEMRARMAVVASSLVVLCEPNPAWLVGDGVRLMPRDEGEWLATHNFFLDVLEEVEVPFVVLSREIENVADRVAFVLEHVQRLSRGVAV